MANVAVSVHTSRILRIAVFLITMIALISGASAKAITTGKSPFVSGKAIWPAGMEKEKNCSVGFRTLFSAPAGQEAVLRISASSVYRVFLNGDLVGYGPARGPHGYQRVDEWPLHNLADGQNVLSIEVTVYNVNSYYMVDQPGFLQAEVLAQGQVLASTDGKGNRFAAQLLTHRIRKVQRYSFQRPFIEMYRLAAGCDDWRLNADAPFNTIACARTEKKQLLARRVPYPDLVQRPTLWRLGRGHLEPVPLPEHPWKDRSLTKIDKNLGGFVESELEAIPSLEMQSFRSTLTDSAASAVAVGDQDILKDKEFVIHDLGVNLTGFIGGRVLCDRPSRLVLLFDEILSGHDVDFKRLGCVNVISYELQPGEYRI